MSGWHNNLDIGRYTMGRLEMEQVIGRWSMGRLWMEQMVDVPWKEYGCI